MYCIVHIERGVRIVLPLVHCCISSTPIPSVFLNAASLPKPSLFWCLWWALPGSLGCLLWTRTLQSLLGCSSWSTLCRLLYTCACMKHNVVWHCSMSHVSQNKTALFCCFRVCSSSSFTCYAMTEWDPSWERPWPSLESGAGKSALCVIEWQTQSWYPVLPQTSLDPYSRTTENLMYVTCAQNYILMQHWCRCTCHYYAVPRCIQQNTECKAVLGG